MQDKLDRMHLEKLVSLEKSCNLFQHFDNITMVLNILLNIFRIEVLKLICSNISNIDDDDKSDNTDCLFRKY